jgi:hypothetical protein
MAVGRKALAVNPTVSPTLMGEMRSAQLMWRPLEWAVPVGASSGLGYNL